MNNAVILRDLNLRFDLDHLMARLKVRPGSRPESALRRLAEEAEKLANPKAAFKASRLEIEDDGQVRLDGVLFSSRLLVAKTRGHDRAFPYVATAGRELHEWSKGLTGPLDQVFADEIKIAAVQMARQAMEDKIKGDYDFQEVSAMNPGSLKAWPITEQKPLFELLGELPDLIGMSLLPSLMMEPSQSVSGIFFKTDQKFHNCQICPKEDCPGRKAPFNEEEAIAAARI